MNSFQKKVACSTTFAFLLPIFALAQGNAPNKSKYHLFNPTPKAEMRELVTDRPDKTEAPYTLDAGHFMFETDLATYSRNDDNGILTEDLTLNFINAKFGITNESDLQILLETFKSINVKTAVDESKVSGIGDLTVRFKQNIFGNDAGTSALAVMPFLKIPTAKTSIGNGKVEGGVIIPFGFELNETYSMGTMAQWNLNSDGANGYISEVVTSATIGRDLIGNLGGYIEFWNAVSFASGSEWVATTDFGFTYGVNEDVQLDAGINIGVTDSADDLNPFAGLTMRF